MIVAFDLDDVLRPFLEPLAEFVNENYLRWEGVHPVDDWRRLLGVRNFGQIWGGTLEQAIAIVKEFYHQDSFINIEPAAGAVELVESLIAQGDKVVVVTACHDDPERTASWIQRWFLGISDIYYTGEYEGETSSKLEICLRIGAHVLIDDSLIHMIGCSENGIVPIWLALREPDDHALDIVREHGVRVIRELGAVRGIVEGMAVSGVEMGY
ncbi:MAG: hypothetical protein PHS44_00030 [Candidatus Dojkabacteria bacterium]|jgi:hypothetical protein|nr:hypothetical protein [Candidatus Dojkabacteria bacterium]